MKQILLLLVLLVSSAAYSQALPKVNLYPNPATNFVKVTFSESVQTDITFTVSDILGNKIETFTFKPSESIYVDLSSLNLLNGMYLIKIETGDKVFLKRLLIKNS